MPSWSTKPSRSAAGARRTAVEIGGLGWVCLAVLAAAPTAASCKPKNRFKDAQVLGGQKISARTLNRGYRRYAQFCEPCHGKRGDGKGPASANTLPPPRNFSKGYFKYQSVPAARLPLDTDLMRSINAGLYGTRMPSWDGLLTSHKLAIVHFIKTFSKRWRQETPGTPIPRYSDPWPADQRRSKAIIRGAVIYHGHAQCWECHPSYQDRAELRRSLDQVRTALGAKAPKPVRRPGKLGRAAVVPTEYGPLTPPNFLQDRLRGGESLGDLYRAVGAGIGGTPMPTWSQSLSARDLWAVVHYVASLLRMRHTPAAKSLQKRMREI